MLGKQCKMLRTLALFILTWYVQAKEECPRIACSSQDASISQIQGRVPQYYYYIGGMFGVHEIGPNAYECGQIRERGIQNLEMFLYSIDTYKNRHNVAGGDIKIGTLAFDSCSRVEQTIQQLMSFEKCSVAYYNDNSMTNRIHPRYILGYIGPDRSSEAKATAEILRDMKKVQISTAATSADLDNRDKYPFFLRTSLSDENEIKVIIDIMKTIHFKFTLVVYSDNIFGTDMKKIFESHALSSNICVVKSWPLPVDVNDDTAYTEIVDELSRYTDAYSLVVLANDNYATKLLQSMNTVLAGHFAIFGISSWGTKQSVIQNSNSIAKGAITLSLSEENSNNLDNFRSYFLDLNPWNNTRNIWFKEYWEDKFKCNVDQTGKYSQSCNVNTRLDRSSFEPDTFLGNTQLAVDALLSGIESAREQDCGANSAVCVDFINNNVGNKVYTKTVNMEINGKSFDTKTGSIRPWSYDVHNVIGGTYVKIGTYSSANGLRITQKPINHNGDLYETSSITPVCPSDICCDVPTAPATTQQPSENTTSSSGLFRFDKNSVITGVSQSQTRPDTEYRTRFDLGQTWIIALGVLAGFGLLIVIALEIYILYKIINDSDRQNRKFRSVWLGQLLLFGIALGYLTLFAYIFEPTAATCGITRFGVGFSYALCFSVLLVKLMIITTSKPSNDSPEDSNYLRGSYQILLFLFALGVQIVIDVQWLITVPPQAVKVMTLNKEYSWICNHYTWKVLHGYNNMEYFVRTEFENHVISLVYVMVLILLCAIIGLKSHNIVTNHKESVFISLSSIFTAAIWVGWTLIGKLNDNHLYAHQYGDAAIAFGLLITLTIILATMFIPKVTQLTSLGEEGIYLEDEVDTRYAINNSFSAYGVPPSYVSKSGVGSVVYLNGTGDQIYSEPTPYLDPRANHLRHPKSPNSVHSLPTYVRRPESVYTNGGNTMKMVTVTPDLTGKVRKAQSEFGTAKSNHSYKSNTLKKARSTQDIGAL